jgi:hypothetical protein
LVAMSQSPWVQPATSTRRRRDWWGPRSNCARHMPRSDSHRSVRAGGSEDIQGMPAEGVRCPRVRTARREAVRDVRGNDRTAVSFADAIVGAFSLRSAPAIGVIAMNLA